MRDICSKSDKKKNENFKFNLTFKTKIFKSHSRNYLFNE